MAIVRTGFVLIWYKEEVPSSVKDPAGMRSHKFIDITQQNDEISSSRVQ